MQVTALTYSLADIIKERRYLNNPEVVRPDPMANIDWGYFLWKPTGQVLAYNKKKSMGWSKIEELLNISIKGDEMMVSNYEVSNVLTTELQNKVKLNGMVFHP